ncbi:MAG: sigma-70 family RNA polymerase sigma factor [Acidimicrobiia bacterium]|nr:sigma-70 family RNA polymerase sigma factor [Acidimicrobiia bacterium]
MADRPARFHTFYEGERASLIRAITLVTGDVDRAADAVDEAMAKAFAHWSSVGAYDNPARWVYRVAHNEAISSWRKRRRESVSAYVPDPTWVDPEIPDQEMADAVSSLPDAYREVIVLRYYLDWTQPQIAESIGVPLGTVKSRIGRALGHLREEVGLALKPTG